ncbi:Stem 28 kDa glycoprotein [Vitis vinifera]|uniref:Stem 28 kDa glycoprotein n=1 Tax=Vitis vinifera TaxID=29760 RepID=A0A438HY06_VITVI|nr:Stem 28 kDa glycoprotein [Vitis vinifera]
MGRVALLLFLFAVTVELSLGISHEFTLSAHDLAPGPPTCRTGKYNATLFNSWVLQAKAPALPESLKLYKKLLSLGIKVVFLTGRGGSQRNATVSNLKKEGFLTWEKLILRV